MFGFRFLFVLFALCWGAVLSAADSTVLGTWSSGFSESFTVRFTLSPCPEDCVFFSAHFGGEVFVLGLSNYNDSRLWHDYLSVYNNGSFSSVSSASFDRTVFHDIEFSVSGSFCWVYLDGVLLKKRYLRSSYFDIIKTSSAYVDTDHLDLFSDGSITVDGDVIAVFGGDRVSGLDVVQKVIADGLVTALQVGVAGAAVAIGICVIGAGLHWGRLFGGDSVGSDRVVSDRGVSDPVGNSIGSRVGVGSAGAMSEGESGDLSDGVGEFVSEPRYEGRGVAKVAFCPNCGSLLDDGVCFDCGVSMRGLSVRRVR